MPLGVGAVAQHFLQDTGRLFDKLRMAFEQRKELPLLRHDPLKPSQHPRTLIIPSHRRLSGISKRLTIIARNEAKIVGASPGRVNQEVRRHRHVREDRADP
jgi:hypothetical protein